MDSKTYLKKQDIVNLSGLSVGKVKYYIQLFPEYFEEHFMSGNRHPVYTLDSVEIIKIIASMMRHHTHNDIRTTLNEQGYNPIIDMIDRSTAKIDDSIAKIPKQLPYDINSVVDTMKAQKQIIDIQADTIRRQRDLLEEQKQIIEGLQEKDQT